MHGPHFFQICSTYIFLHLAGTDELMLISVFPLWWYRVGHWGAGPSYTHIAYLFITRNLINQKEKLTATLIMELYCYL